MAKGGRGRGSRSSKRVASDDDDGVLDDATAPAAPNDDNLPAESSLKPVRPSRKTKETADKAWEMLKPGAKRRKSQAASDDESGSNPKKRKTGAQSKSQNSTQLAAAQYPAPAADAEDENDEKQLASGAELQAGTERHLPPKFIKHAFQPSDPDEHGDGGAHDAISTASTPAKKRHIKRYASDEDDESEDDDDDELEPTVKSRAVMEEEAEEEDGEDDDDDDDDDGDQQDERALARQFEAEKASWVSDNPTDEEFPDASAFAPSQRPKGRARTPPSRLPSPMDTPTIRYSTSGSSKLFSDGSPTPSAPQRRHHKRLREETSDDEQVASAVGQNVTISQSKATSKKRRPSQGEHAPSPVASGQDHSSTSRRQERVPPVANSTSSQTPSQDVTRKDKVHGKTGELSATNRSKAHLKDVSTGKKRSSAAHLPNQSQAGTTHGNEGTQHELLQERKAQKSAMPLPKIIPWTTNAAFMSPLSNRE
ncbi:hypothetical protein BN946_scf185044.g22 [Trametes cinnabarina]|uniref:Uncharacterized protein n=1 Tax=Pycnoporus cinnabarinus TaxID=5643 RepID=A0A060S748_PYCCI|nr:hypothetical protein BN946_scf185044.g22 [Trametes cinnabarina]